MPKGIKLLENDPELAKRYADAFGNEPELVAVSRLQCFAKNMFHDIM